ncbi:MAG: DUF1992 domain-containing protein [Planctomycetaceae bacterium]|nr:DUF1992 domain-containing protein [Planctomycetaceae bacterium]
MTSPNEQGDIDDQSTTQPPGGRKPQFLSWESFADRRIREAQAAGAFDKLPGFGQPIPGIDDPLNENWWIKRKLREEGVSVIPPVLEARREIERTRAAIAGMKSETEVRRRLEALSEFVRRAMYSPVAGPADGVTPIDVEDELRTWRDIVRGPQP